MMIMNFENERKLNYCILNIYIFQLATVDCGQPGFKEIQAEMKKEMTWDGRKTFMKASFDESGKCIIYPATAGVKSKYSW